MRIDDVVAPATRSAATPSGGSGDPRRDRPTGIRAHACVATTLRAAPSGKARTVVSTLRSAPPLALRLTMAKGPEPWVASTADLARVCLAAGAAGPIGGDELSLDVDVGAGSCLVLAEVSPTLALPGPHGKRSHTRTRIRVAAGGTLIWLPEPIIAVRGCDHLNHVHAELEEGARLLIREETLLGRHGEQPGVVRHSVQVRLGSGPLYRQDLDLGTPGAQTPPVLGSHRAAGSVLVVDPDWTNHRLEARRLPGDAALLPLAGPAALITALSGDSLALRRQLEAGLAALGPPWDPHAAPDPRQEPS